MRILHTADVHLGGRPRGRLGPALSRARFAALEKATAIASERCDLFIVAGDLFDTATPDRDTSARAVALLSGSRVPVALITGNHDPLVERSVWERDEWQNLPDTVRLFTDAVPVVKPWDLDVVLYPCGLRAASGRESPLAWIPSARAEVVGCATYHVGIAHGALLLAPDMDATCFPIEPSELDTLGLDYLALGHWHRRTPADEAHSMRCAYCGSPEQLAHDQSDGAVLLVELKAKGIAVASERTGTYDHIAVERVVTEAQDVISLGDELIARDNRDHTLLRISLSGTAPLDAFEEAERLAGRLDEAGFAQTDVSTHALEPEPRDLELARLPPGPLRRTVEMLVAHEREAVAEEKAVARRAVALAWRMFTES